MSVRAEAPVAEEEHDASHEGTAGAHSGAHRAVHVSSVVASARSLLGSGAESLRKAVGGTRELTQEDLDKIVAAPIHIRWEIVRLAELRELGASIEARWPFIAALLANQESNLPIAAEYLKKRKVRVVTLHPWLAGSRWMLIMEGKPRGWPCMWLFSRCVFAASGGGHTFAERRACQRDHSGIHYRLYQW